MAPRSVAFATSGPDGAFVLEGLDRKMYMLLGEDADHAQARVEGTWKVCTPENAREFSAVGYFFARDLHKALDVPVGIITAVIGGPFFLWMLITRR